MTKASRLWSKRSKKEFSRSLLHKNLQNDVKSTKFNLLIITQFFPPDFAATGQLIQELARNLGETDIQVNVFTGQPGYAFQQEQAPNKEVEKNLTIRRSRTVKIASQRIRTKALSGIIFTLRATLTILKNGRKNNVVLLTTAPPFLSIAGYIANLFLGLEYICLIYDLYPDAVVELGIVSEGSFIAKLWNKINTFVWQKSKKIIVLSETMKQRIIDRHPQFDDKISVIHNWADADWIKPIQKEENWFARQHKLDHKFTVLYSGNMGRCHDLETILGTIKLLQHEPVQFVFIGAGTKHEQCRQAVAEFKLNNCTFLPYQDKTNLPYSLTACDLALVSIAPGLEGVVAPSKLYGIMAAGKAIAAICEPHSYLRQIVDNAACGASFDNQSSQELADFIISLARNPELAANMGNAGRSYMIENFTPKIITGQYRQVLDVNTTQQENNTQPTEPKHLDELPQLS
ncbi:glycosyltransferase family 4 protein [Waterburya agarophytonicola K14]|uniref:Glycosyltransferase family 4 protein n=1 Tax=Waterburya agarophytonicola KI4 TaxID=2874699 RepID=A0A964BLR9_9CYAN|nr:glycosyltransferase family 4 protein [Waterburya agarophytonicola]MCC0175729.1 glycosyltransferase family 4 protein [Waterburya agarophytonicola KI4]